MGQTNRGENRQKIVLRIRIRKPDFAAIGKSLLSLPQKVLTRVLGWQLRYRFLLAVVILILAEVYSVLSPYFQEHSYALGAGEALLPESSPEMASKIRFDTKQQQYSFNADQPAASSDTAGANMLASATAPKDPSKGISVTDPVNKVDFKMIPKFRLQVGKQDKDRIVYPLSDGTGWLVYTMRGVGTKEDIVLNHANSNNASYSYTLELGDSLQAKLQSDGSIGIFGNTLLSGNVSTGSDKDAELLKKARQGAAKDHLLFAIPKPVVFDKHGEANGIESKYELNGNELTLKVIGLNNGHYPLTIDPSIYVVTAQQFMAGNNETNINFDVDNKLIKKGRTTGARFDQWNTASSLPRKVWGSQTVAAGGYIYSIGGTSFDGQVYTSQGASTYTVPTGVTSIDVKVWGAGGGGGGGGTVNAAPGGNGGGGGFVQTTISVTPGETLDIYVGGGGLGGSRNGMGYGGGGGGYSSIFRGSNPLVIAAGGAGGGGGRGLQSNTGGAGGAGGGTSGVNGSDGGGTAGAATGGFGGTQSAGGATGTNGTTPGTAGSSLAGGRGGNGSTLTDGSGGNGGAANGGLATGGPGGLVSGGLTRAAGGGGGSGYYGGGGGVGGTGSTGGSGGGGGSSYDSTGTGTLTAGSGTSPGGSSDTDRLGAGDGGTGGQPLNSGTAGDNGLVSIANGVAATTASTQVNWAKLNTGTGTIDNADPGTGTCTTWCSTAAYNLPGGRSNYSLVAYNGYLYAMGGTNSSCTAGNGTGTTGYCKTVYIAKLGANGEPRLWHPTDSNPSNWSYWYRDTDLPNERAYSAAVAYNNRMYLLGGTTSSGVTNAVHIADITPNSKLGTWNSSAATLPSANQYDLSAQVYNDRLYVLGGSSSTTAAPTNTVYYNKINTDGSLNSWVQTSSFTSGRISNGGKISVVWGGYMYISGGCTAVNASGYCTTVASDTQLASINADGSLDTWSTVANVSSTRTGHSLVAWRDNIYAIGGCSSVDTNGGGCSLNMLDSISYGKINQDGDVSTVSTSSASGAGACSGSTPTNCNIPSTGSVGNYLTTSVVSNGYLYVIGGCTNVGCTTTSGGTAFTQVTPSGDLVQPSSCPSGSTATNGWCVMNASISGGIAGAAPTVYNDTIYLVGGFSGSALTNTIYRATVNPTTGLLGTWTSDSMTTAGATSVSYTYATIRANPTSILTVPGNLYIFGGCTTSGSGPDCAAYTQNVYKCNIGTNGAVSSCTTTSQLQIGTPTGASGTGLGLMSGAIYANYIYLIGGSAPGLDQSGTVRYAKFDSSNNVVTTNSGWVESSQTLATPVRSSSSFIYNGYLYSVGGYNSSSGIRNTVQFIKINTNDGSLDTDGWKTSAVTITGKWGLRIVASNSYAYMIGGCTTGAALTSCSAATSTVERVKIYNNASGGPVSWAASANAYTTDRFLHGSTILNGYIYVAGGCTSIGSSGCDVVTNDVASAPIDSATGAIGTWINSTSTPGTVAPLPSARTGGKLVAVGGTLYYVGGSDAYGFFTNTFSTVWYTTPSAGAISSWSTATNGIPSNRTNLSAAVWNNRIYVVGGYSSACGATWFCSAVYVSPVLSSGGDITSAWSSSSPDINGGRQGAGLVAYANNLYVIGGALGDNNGTPTGDVQYAKIDTSTGNVGSWTYTTSLPTALREVSAFAANGYLYVIGGKRTDGTCSSQTYAVPIAGNTTIASGNNPTGIGNWFSNNSLLTGTSSTAPRYGASAVYNEGKAYLTGGICSSFSSMTKVQQTALLSQPQVAKYSIMQDTDSDVFPTNWLLNGVDNSIGARWQLKYRSATDPTKATVGGGAAGRNCSTAETMTTWGTETNFGNISLGVPGIYTPRDSSNNNTNCARYYYFNVSVDSSQAFGFPDDVTRGPTITDLTLRMTSDPAKRLMHGRTFTGGLQMPVDTPYNSN